VQGVDAARKRCCHIVEGRLVGGERAAGAGEAKQRAELAAAGSGKRLGPIDGGTFHERLGGVAEAHRIGAVGLLDNCHLGKRRELVQQHVAAVKHVVGLLMSFFGELDLLVELSYLVGVVLHFA
jgi:hypothetical protein